MKIKKVVLSIRPNRVFIQFCLVFVLWVFNPWTMRSKWPNSVWRCPLQIQTRNRLSIHRKILLYYRIRRVLSLQRQNEITYQLWDSIDSNSSLNYRLSIGDQVPSSLNLNKNFKRKSPAWPAELKLVWNILLWVRNRKISYEWKSWA